MFASITRQTLSCGRRFAHLLQPAPILVCPPSKQWRSWIALLLLLLLLLLALTYAGALPRARLKHPHAALPVQVRRSDVLSAWSGLRPLALDSNAKDTASASRDHVVTRDPDGMITVTGAFCCGLARGFYACRPCAFPGCPLQAHHLTRADFFVRAACLSWCAGRSGDLGYSASLHCCTSSRSHDTAFAP